MLPGSVPERMCQGRDGMFAEHAGAFLGGYMDQAGRYLWLPVTAFLPFILRGNFLPARVAPGIQALAGTVSLHSKLMIPSNSPYPVLFFIHMKCGWNITGTFLLQEPFVIAQEGFPNQQQGFHWWFWCLLEVARSKPNRQNLTTKGICFK